MITVYRLEDKDGNGPFVYRNGVCRNNPSIQFHDDGLYCFIDINRFLEPSYREFLEDDRFMLYEIKVSELLVEWKSGQALFDESHVLEKNEMRFDYE